MKPKGHKAGCHCIVCGRRPNGKRRVAKRRNASTYGVKSAMRLVAKVGDVRVYRDTDWNQYVVKPTAKSRERSWSYSDSKQDALDIAKDIAGRAAKRKTNPKSRSRSLTAFIAEHKAEIDAAIRRMVPGARIDNAERRLWVLNDEGLYRMARRWGWRG